MFRSVWKQDDITSHFPVLMTGFLFLEHPMEPATTAAGAAALFAKYGVAAGSFAGGSPIADFSARTYPRTSRIGFLHRFRVRHLHHATGCQLFPYCIG